MATVDTIYETIADMCNDCVYHIGMADRNSAMLNDPDKVKVIQEDRKAKGLKPMDIEAELQRANSSKDEYSQKVRVLKEFEALFNGWVIAKANPYRLNEAGWKE